ncbi:ECF transporter S component [Clostridium fermenticellae]|uniref:Riboflavin transporter n=1 Tax=Clostridium fermenticellae TaxID=2068654 RepID=A0A386H679_9CLOT|nr:ECF transporter S component [Clostridium fermenticellae]AYD41261.1 ECF transporter S component [Clostridium fermenticellae]
MKRDKLNRLVKISLLSVIGFILMFIEVAIPIFPSFLQMDISDLPALIGSFALGPSAGVAIELVKNILHGVFDGKTAFIGELANFLVGSVLVFTAGYIYKMKKSKKTAVYGLISGSLLMTIAASILNYVIFLPLYEKVLNFPISAIIAMTSKINPAVTDLNGVIVWAIAPFNLIKGVILLVLTMVVYKSVSPILHDESTKELVKNN